MAEITATIRLKGPPSGDAAAVRARIAAGLKGINGGVGGVGGTVSAGLSGAARGAGNFINVPGSRYLGYIPANHNRVVVMKDVQRVNQAFTTAVDQAAKDTAAALLTARRTGRGRTLAKTVEDTVEHGPGGHNLSSGQKEILTGYQFLEHGVGYQALKGAGLPGIVQLRNLMMAMNQVSAGALSFAGVLGGLAIAVKAASAVESALKERDQALRLAPYQRGRPVEDVIDNPAQDPSTYGDPLGGFRKGPDIAGGILGWASNARDLYRRMRGLPEDPDKMGSAATDQAKRDAQFQDAKSDAAKKNAEYQKRVNEALKDQADHLEVENQMIGKSPRRRAVMAAQEEADAYKRRLERQPENEPVTAEQKRMSALLQARADKVRMTPTESVQTGMTSESVWSEIQKRLFDYRNDKQDQAADKQNQAADKQLAAADKKTPTAQGAAPGGKGFVPPTYHDLKADAMRRQEETGKATNVPKAYSSPIRGGAGGTTTVPNPEAFQRSAPKPATAMERRALMIQRQRQLGNASGVKQSDLDDATNEANQKNVEDEDRRVGGGSRTLGAFRRWTTALRYKDNNASDAQKEADQRKIDARRKMLQPRIDAELNAARSPQQGASAKDFDKSVTKLGDAADKLAKAKPLYVAPNP